jgi:hypothetical protein
MEGLLQTVAILAACIVFLAKQAVDAYSKRKNGMGAHTTSTEKSMLSDLHRWHKPVADPATGQPRFMWYENSLMLQEELKRNRESMDELKSALERMSENISALVEQIKKCPGPKSNP